MVFGTFDVIHPGHRFFLEQAALKGDRLVAVIARDEFVNKIKVNGLRVTLSMDNLFTLTRYSGSDPDVPLYMGSWTLPGTQYFKYPINKQFLLGLEFSF